MEEEEELKCNNCNNGVIKCPGCEGEKESILGICAGCNGSGVRTCGKCGGKSTDSYAKRKRKCFIMKPI